MKEIMIIPHTEGYEIFTEHKKFTALDGIIEAVGEINLPIQLKTITKPFRLIVEHATLHLVKENGTDHVKI